MYHFAQVLLILNVLGCVWFTNKVLDGKFYTLGLQWILANGVGFSTVVKILDGNLTKSAILTRIFPKRTSCAIKYMGGGGGTHEQHFYCVLAPNVLSQYIFLILWFWYGFLLIIHLINLFLVIGMMCNSANLRAIYLTRAVGSRKVTTSKNV